MEANPVIADSSGPFITRTLSYTIHRDLGQIGDVAVTVSNAYDMVSCSSIVLSNQQLSRMLAIPDERFNIIIYMYVRCFDQVLIDISIQ